jgi:hypothetical protein
MVSAAPREGVATDGTAEPEPPEAVFDGDEVEQAPFGFGDDVRQ